MDPWHRLGWVGEKEAAKFLRRSGYKVLYRRFRPRDRKGEIDLVCRHGETLVFVEVKTRSSLAYGRPADAVDAARNGSSSRACRRGCGCSTGPKSRSASTSSRFSWTGWNPHCTLVKMPLACRSSISFEQPGTDGTNRVRLRGATSRGWISFADQTASSIDRAMSLPAASISMPAMSLAAESMWPGAAGVHIEHAMILVDRWSV